MPFTLRSLNHDVTAALGRGVASLVIPGDVIVLAGPLGAGKTRFVQGFAAGLDVSGRVTSPTFVLVRRHAGRIPLVHVDAYRLDDAAALVTLDAGDDVSGEHVAPALPEERLEVEVRVDGDVGDAPRDVTITAHGTGWGVRSERLEEVLRPLAMQQGDA
jgi:tRNA threonylcarbamoyladenosine biosynthesis protein TsaE